MAGDEEVHASLRTIDWIDGTGVHCAVRVHAVPSQGLEIHRAMGPREAMPNRLSVEKERHSANGKAVGWIRDVGIGGGWSPRVELP